MIKGDNDNQDLIEPALLGALVESLAPVEFPAARAALVRQAILAAAAATPIPAIRLAEQAPWIEFVPGIRLRPLRIDRAARTQTSLWEMSPGSTIPPHPHSGEEECLVLDGVLEYAGREYRRGDFLLAVPGLHHTEFSTTSGTLLMLRSELTRPLERVFAQAGL